MAESTLSRAALLQGIPRDDHTLSQDRLNIAGKVRSNLFPWKGQFSPQLVHAFLDTYGGRGDFVLDPFMGSGTVLVEAGRLNRRAFDAEINPAAYKMAQVYAFVNFSPQARRALLEQVGDGLCRAFNATALFSNSNDSENASAKEALLSLWSGASTHSPAGKLLESLIVLLDFYKPGLTPRRILDTWNKLALTVAGLPFSTRPTEPVNCDARQLPLPSAVVDLVITSPPYINVFNYHQQYRASVEALGCDALHVARSEIGSNRKNRGNRFLTVAEYCLDITQALVEMHRVCKRSARLICVVGRESNVLKTRFFNGEIVARLGVRCAGLTAESRQERVFTNRFGARIYEEIIHFRPGATLAPRDRPIDIARDVLNAAIAFCPHESLADLEDAISRLQEIKPSSLYHLPDAKIPEKK